MTSPLPPVPHDIAATLADAEALRQAGNSAGAQAVLEQAMGLAPQDPDIRFALGLLLLDQDQTARAAGAFLKASRLAPAWLAPRLMLAKTLVKLGRATDATSILRQTTSDMPEAAEAWMQLGNLQRETQDNAGAEASYRRCAELSPTDANAFNNLGVALRAQNRLPESIAAYQKALIIDPALALAQANLGNALDAAGRPDEAEPHLRKAVALLPDNTDAQYNLAVHLIREEKPDDAVPVLRRLLSDHPQRWDAWTNLGVGLVATGNLQEAEACYRQALRLRPTAPEAHYNLAWLLLLTGQWDEGWREYEWRWHLPTFSSLKRNHTTPHWSGTPAPQATLLLHAEQGLGDTIQFVRFAKIIRPRVARMILECPPSLIPLLNGVEGIDGFVATGQPLPPHDMHAHLMSLPRLLAQRVETLPSVNAYITAPNPQPHALKLPKTRRMVGIVWAGSPDNKIDKRRSCPAVHFKSLLSDMNLDVVSLQTGPRAQDADAPTVTAAIDGRVKSWADTAAVVSQLDLVIAVDTAVAHLAGAMGKPCWILLPSSPDFRWLLDRNDTPWYSSVRLFRQRVRGDWDGLFADLKAALTLWLQSPN